MCAALDGVSSTSAWFLTSRVILHLSHTKTESAADIECFLSMSAYSAQFWATKTEAYVEAVDHLIIVVNNLLPFLANVHL